MSYDKYPSYGRFRKRSGTETNYIYLGTWGYYLDGVEHTSIPWYHDGKTILEKICLDDLNPGPPYTSGGYFSLIKSEEYPTLIGGGRYRSHEPSYDPFYDGYLAMYWPKTCIYDTDMLNVGADGTPFDYDWLKASDFGASAWNRFRPKLNTADLGVAVAEAKDIPRMLKKTAEGFHYIWKSMGGSRSAFGPKSVADHWLNTQFGWKPFINDLSDLFSTAKNFSSTLDKQRRHNGRWLKRSGTFSKTESREMTDEGTSQFVWPSLPTGCFASSNYNEWFKWRIYNSVIDHVWFEGRFRYWIPSLSSDHPYDKAMNALRMYGLRVSPTLVWEATPWSWLVDWFSNAGDVVNNLTAMMYDNLAAKYAYVMRHRRFAYELEGSVYLKDGTLSGSLERSIESKNRDYANPFGFGLSWDDLSSWQLSILGALGITRRR